MAFALNLIKSTLDNQDYRRVVFSTDKGIQLVLQSLNEGEVIDGEIHEKIDQLINVVSGSIQVQVAELMTSHPMTSSGFFIITEGNSIIIPRGTYHKVTATKLTKLNTIYTPPNHDPNLVQVVKPLY